MIILLYNILLIWFFCSFFRATAARPRSGVVYCVLIHFDALQAFLSAFLLIPYNYIKTDIKRLKRAFNRVIKAYITPVYIQAIQENSPPGCINHDARRHSCKPDTQPARIRRKSLYQNFGFYTNFSTSKTFGVCVQNRIFEKSKNP